MSSECHLNLTALTIGTVLSFLSIHSSIVEKPILKWLNKQTGKERNLMVQRNALKAEQLCISMAEEFTKYSKLQRRINSIDVELEQIKGKKPTNSFIVQLGFTYGVKLVLIFFLILLSLYYRNTPVLYLGDKVSLTPFTHLICYPNEVNYVSFYFWAMCNASVARMI